MVKHGMIDLETLGTTPNSVVLTIGAVKFDPFTNDEPIERLHLKLNTEEQFNKGRIKDDDTLAWWLSQDKEVRDAAFTEYRVSINDGLNALMEWSKDVSKIWCQGPSFDFPMLYSLHRDFNMDYPFNKFWLQRDSRTITSLVNDNLKEKINYNAHDAVEDCVKQAKCVQYVYKKLNINHTF